MRIFIINGPNLNMLGIREPEIYGRVTFESLISQFKTWADDLGVEMNHMQSNHEGAIVDAIQQCYKNYDAIVINPGAYTHTSVAILDALKAVQLPAVEVHISDVDSREPFRQISYPGMYCEKTIKGQGIDGYRQAMEYLVNKYRK